MAQQLDTKYNFYQAAKLAYPDVADPGLVWVAATVLGWDWDTISRTSLDGFDRKGYRRFVLDQDGKRQYDKHKPRVVTYRWTKEEKAQLRDWWWLLGL